MPTLSTPPTIQMSLRTRLKRHIAADGPMTVEAFMHLCLHDPEFGYYATRPALGEGGDFITAPLISQMFGELIGLWAVDVWTRLGQPAPFRLVEMGPGDGTLMSDILRAARLAPSFRASAELWLVETSGPLMDLQRKALAAHGPRWAPSLTDVPSGAPILLIANELLDCLAARQFIRVETGWAERRVGLDRDGELCFGLSPAPSEFTPPEGLQSAELGALIEISSAQEALGAALGVRIAEDGGAALFIDYGREGPQTGDTLQALLRHQKVDILATAGEADLTIHADFPAFVMAARAAGAAATPIIRQGDFLRALGLELRAAALIRAKPDQADSIDRQRRRLSDADGMGTLFKVACIHQPDLQIAGF
jgi:NADH dehydrogenase [ubiquinone] 1 alpha subcomplex assembly factor 7